jgi:hypothetical protein
MIGVVRVLVVTPRVLRQRITFNAGTGGLLQQKRKAVVRVSVPELEALEL